MSRVTPLLCPLLVGRDDLLDLADRRLADAAEGRGHFLLLAGEAGIGKTRLLGAVLRKASAHKFEIADGGVAPQDRTVPASLMLDLARTMLRIPAYIQLGHDLLALPYGPDGGKPRSRRLLVVDMVDRIVESLDTPAMLAFEDLQWADDLSLEVVAELARRIRDRPVLMVGTYRTDELPTGTMLREWRARLLTQRMAEEARLTPLTVQQTALMTTLILSTGLPAPREVVAAVHERTDGIPLHIEELLGALGEEGRSDGHTIREATVPATIEDAVLARFARLSPEGRAVAQAGAVIGRCFVPEVLAGIMDLPPAALDAPLQELVDQAFLDPPGPRGLFDYRHQLLRDVLYRSISRSALQRLHARAGEFGAQLEGASEIHASVHFERAGLRAEAFRAALAGAREAARLSSHREAFELYRRAVDNMPPDIGASEHGALLEAFSDEAAAIEQNDITGRMAQAARERYLAAGLPVAAARMYGALASVWRRTGQPVGDRIATLRAGLSELEFQPASPERDRTNALLLTYLAVMLLDAHQLGEARATADAARAAAAAVGDAGSVIDATARLAAVDVVEGRVDEGLAAVDEAACEARAAGYEDIGVTAYRDAALLAVRVMDYPRAEAWLCEGMRYADAIEQSHCRHVMGATDALIAWADGRWDEAVAMGQQALADQGGGARAATMARWALGYVALGRGELLHARSLLEEALVLGQPSGALDLVLPALWGLAETALLAGDHAGAAERCDAALTLSASHGERALVAPFVVTGVRAYLAAGRPSDADRWLTRVAGHLAISAWFSRPAVDHGTGIVRLAAGSTGSAREALEAAVRGWDDRNRLWEATWARLDLVTCLLRSHRVADAMSLLGDIEATATRLESEPLAARASELRRLARGRGSLDEPWRPLTSREFEVARLIADGMTNAELAGELSIAPKTASAHVEHILAKLGVTRRSEIAVWAANGARATGGAAQGAPPPPEPPPSGLVLVLERQVEAGHPRVPVGEEALGVRLPEPEVDLVEVRQVVGVRCRNERQLLAEEARRVAPVRCVPGVLEDDVLDRHESIAAADARLVDERFRPERVERRVADQAALDVVLAHRADAGVLGAALDRSVTGRHRDVEIVERRCGCPDVAKVPAAVGFVRRRDRRAEHGDDGQQCDHDGESRTRGIHHAASTETS